MKLKFTEEFRNKLGKQVEFIALDKPSAARKFRKDLLKEIREIPKSPMHHRKSIYFDDVSIRELIFKGYKVLFEINEEENMIYVFSFLKHQEKP